MSNRTGCFDKLTKEQFDFDLNKPIMKLSKRYKSTEVDYIIWLHVPRFTSSDTHQVVERQKGLLYGLQGSVNVHRGATVTVHQFFCILPSTKIDTPF